MNSFEPVKTSAGGAFADREDLKPVNSRAILEELFALLEEYGPSWYTQDHYDRLVAALQARNAWALPPCNPGADRAV